MNDDDELQRHKERQAEKQAEQDRKIEDFDEKGRAEREPFKDVAEKDQRDLEQKKELRKEKTAEHEKRKEEFNKREQDEIKRYEKKAMTDEQKDAHRESISGKVATLSQAQAQRQGSQSQETKGEQPVQQQKPRQQH